MIYLILLIISFLLTYYIKNYYIKNALLDEVNERSSHSIATPHGGGIAIAITWFSGLIYLFFIDKIDINLFYALMVGIIISIVSFFDDIYELTPKIRIIAQSIVAILGLLFLDGLKVIDLGFYVIENGILTTIFSFLLIVWFINLYNFLDGINGYAGMEALFLSFSGFILFGDNHFLVLIVAVLGFLYWNWNRAKIFMGDVGSTLLGYNIAIFTIYYANEDSINFWIWIILFGVFWFDATITLMRRKLNGEKLSIAHKKHAYQRLTQYGWSHLRVTNYALILNLLLFIIVMSSIWLETNIFFSFFISIVLLYSVTKFIDKKKEF